MIITECVQARFESRQPALNQQSWVSCSKLTTSLVKVSLNFQTFISQIRQYFLLQKCEKLLNLVFKKGNNLFYFLFTSLDDKAHSEMGSTIKGGALIAQEVKCWPIDIAVLVSSAA